jgi:hypothetical protein
MFFFLAMIECVVAMIEFAVGMPGVGAAFLALAFIFVIIGSR